MEDVAAIEKDQSAIKENDVEDVFIANIVQDMV